jgi:hypothetical protein
MAGVKAIKFNCWKTAINYPAVFDAIEQAQQK